MAFWIAAVVLVAVSVAVLLGTLLRSRRADALRRDYDLAVFRDQLDEVDRDVERGVLAEDEAEAARIEIKRRMLAAVGSDAVADETKDARRSLPAPARRVAVLAIAVLVPAGVFALYMEIGAPGVADQPLAERLPDSHATATAENGEMENLTARLAEQMEAQPDNPDGWLLLARSYRTLERYPEAINAFERAVALTGRAPMVLSEYGELLVLAHGGEVPGPAVQLFEEVKAAAPTEPRSRYYLGLAQAQAGNARAALQTWVDLVAVSPDGAPWLDGVRGRITSVAADAGIDPATLSPSADLPEAPPPPATTPPTPQGPQSTPRPATPPVAGSQPVAPAPDTDAVRAAAEMTDEERQQMIRGMVEGLAARLKDEPDDADGWRRLARAYQVLGETEKAEEAMARAETADRKANP